MVVSFVVDGSDGLVDARKLRVYRRPDGRFYVSGCFDLLEPAPMVAETHSADG